MAKINISLKNKKAATDENITVVIDLLAIQWEELSEETQQDIIIAKLDSTIRNQNIKIFEQSRIIDMKNRDINSLRKELINSAKLKAENVSLTYANGRLATASIQLDEENKKLKAELEKLKNQNATLFGKIQAINNLTK